MEVTILGNNSALPAFGRHPTAQLLQIEGQRIMIDCGESAQIQMRRYQMRLRHLDHILISHLHGDHYFGLPGLLNSLHLNGRTAPLHLFGPQSLQGILDCIWTAANTKLNYPLHFHALSAGHNHIATHPVFDIYSFPTEHRIECYGFIISSKAQNRSLLLEECQKRKIPLTEYHRLIMGEDASDENGAVIPNHLLTTSAKPPKRYAYCADTLSTECFLEAVRGVDTIYHESTFLQADAEKAKLRFHSTSQEAAQLALKAGAQQLLLGHYSSRYEDLSAFESEAKEIFANTIGTREGQTYTI